MFVQCSNSAIGSCYTLVSRCGFSQFRKMLTDPTTSLIDSIQLFRPLLLLSLSSPSAGETHYACAWPAFAEHPAG